MPYITQQRREVLASVGAVPVAAAEELNKMGSPLSPGDLNYIISRLVWAEFDRLPSYTKGNELVGVLECVKQEFIRRRLNGYEDKKIEENGDL